MSECFIGILQYLGILQYSSPILNSVNAHNAVTKIAVLLSIVVDLFNFFRSFSS